MRTHTVLISMLGILTLVAGQDRGDLVDPTTVKEDGPAKIAVMPEETDSTLSAGDAEGNEKNREVRYIQEINPSDRSQFFEVDKSSSTAAGATGTGSPEPHYQLSPRPYTPKSLGGVPWYGSEPVVSAIPESRLPATVTGLPSKDMEPPVISVAPLPTHYPVVSGPIPRLQYPLPVARQNPKVFKVVNGTVTRGDSPATPTVSSNQNENISSSNTEDRAPPTEDSVADFDPEVTPYSDPNCMDPEDRLESQFPLDEAVQFSMGVRCFHCGEVDSNANVVKACPPMEKRVKDWVHRNKIRTWICPSGCLTVTDPKTDGVARMCWHVGVRQLGRRIILDENRKKNFNRCFYAGCNAISNAETRSAGTSVTASASVAAATSFAVAATTALF